MDKQTSQELFLQIQSEYNSVKRPKYRNMQLDDWKHKYEMLIKMKEYLIDDVRYVKLINAVSQVLSKLEKQNTPPSWSNVSERGINKAIPALVKKGHIEIDFPFQWDDEKTGHKCSINNGYWGAKNYMLMDALGHFYLFKEGGDRLPQNPSEIFQDLESIQKREIEFDKNSNGATSKPSHLLLTDDDIIRIENSKHWVRFDDKLFRKFTSLNLGTNDILKLIHETSQVEFKLKFPVRMKEGKKLKEKQYMMNMFSRLFEFGYMDKQIRSHDGAVRSREYFVTFNTMLGELFAHNLKTINYDWISSNFYNLPGSAQVFFRRFLIHNDFPKMSINLSNIVQKINLVDTNITNLIKTIETNILEPLKQYGFIDSFEKTKGLHGLKYVIHRQFNNK